MAATTKMTWDPKSKRWFKNFNGKMYAASPRQLRASFPELFLSATKDGSVRAANAWWDAKRAELEERAFGPQRKEWLEHLTIRQHMVAWYERERETGNDHFRQLQGEIDRCRTAIQQIPTPPVTLFPPYNDLPAGCGTAIEWLERIDLVRKVSQWDTSTGGPAKSLKNQIRIFLDSKSVECGPGRVDALDNHLCHLISFLQSDSLDVLTSANLLDFRAHLLRSCKQSRFTTTFAGCIIDTAYTFVTWLWEREVIENMPRVSKRKLRIAPEIRKIPTFAIGQIRQLLGAAKPRRKLYYLLMLNCGMTQKDVADLKPSEVDWDEGRIKRKRSKTQDHERVPVVNYKLWNETFDLLKRFGHRTGDRVLTTTKGTPLVVVAEKTSGKRRTRKVDLIGRAYRKWRSKFGAGFPALKCMRKTSPTLFDEHPEFSSFAQYFLGQAPATIMDRHYRDRSQRRFDDAVKWLGEQYGLV